MENSHLAEHLEDKENYKRFQQERLILDISSLIYSTMKKKGVTQTQLAENVGVSKGRISQYLGGERNLRLRTIADIFTALNCRLQLSADTTSKDGWVLVDNSSEIRVLRPSFCIPDECFDAVEIDSHQLAG